MLIAETITVVNDFELPLELDVISIQHESLISWLLHSGKQSGVRQTNKTSIITMVDFFSIVSIKP